MPRGDKRQQIIQASEKLFTSRRFDEIKMSDIAAAAHVGKGTIYQYFEDKNDLFFQLVTSGLDELCDILGRSQPADGPFAAQLLDACVTISDFFDHRQPLMRLMHSEGGRMLWSNSTFRERFKEKHRKLVATVGSVIAKGSAEGAVRPDIPPDVLASFLLGMLRTRAHELQDAPEDVRRLELAVDLFCSGAGFKGISA